MDRKTVYTSELPLDGDFLQIQRNMLIALAYDVQAWGGTNTIADGLACVPTAPASLAVLVNPGSLCSVSAVDQTAYGVLAADSTHQIMQQGILLDAASLTLTPPTTSGFATNYLIQVQFQQIDTDSTVLAYFNSANPSIPFSGPAGSGTPQNTSRKGLIAVQAKAGVAATAGTQTTPSPDAGWTGLYSVTVANGATALTSAQITQLATAPFLSVKLPQMPAWVQQGTFAYSADTGTTNAISVTLSPAPAAYPVSIFVKKIGTPNSGAMTIAFPSTSLGTVSVINADGSTMTSAQMAASFMAHLVWDGTSYRFMNGVATTSVGALTASGGEGINVNGSAVVALNYPALTTKAALAGTDLISFYSQADAHHRTQSVAQFASAFNSFITFPSYDFSNLQNVAGYQKLPGGLILQWGTVNWGSSQPEGLYGPYSYPIPFPGSSLHMQITTIQPAAGGEDNTVELNIMNMPTKTQFWVYNNWPGGGSSNGAGGFTWFAIGN